jgi:CRP/FNR family transcriptional regulator, cyclic AMP receptor protein
LTVSIKRRRPTVDHLQSFALFQACTRKELERVSSLASPSAVTAGTVLCSQGQYGRETFIVVSGEADVTLDGSVIATLGSGSFFGEMSVLDGDPRVATVTARTPMSLLVFTTSEFHALVKEFPSVARRVMVAMSGRLRLADRALSTREPEPSTSK